MPLRDLFIDFDAFFASVEQQRQPRLRGRPVAVVPVMADTTCCIAASYEAKRFGIKTGTRVSDARHLCPELICVLADHEQYVAYHHRLIAAVETCMPVEAVLSIDEMVCTLTGSWHAPALARRKATEIKAAIAVQVGTCLTCSIGIAPNRFLAKVASDMAKPDGLQVIDNPDLPQALYALALSDLYGVGRRMLKRLSAHGIDSVPALYRCSAAELRAIWGGVGGERMYARLRGEREYEPPIRRASVSHSHVLPPALRNEVDALAVLHRLLQKAAWRLRKLKCLTAGLSLDLDYADGRHWRATRRFAATQDTVALSHVLAELWRLRSGQPPLKVGINLFHLQTPGCEQPSLFADAGSRARLNATVDRVNARFGKNALYFGGAHRALNEAPMRIAFNHIPDVETER
jgi:DNA polymerase IV